MKLPRHELAQALAKRTLHLRDSSLLAKEVAAYLLSENRTDELEPLMRDIMQYRLDNGIVEATIVTAHDVGQEFINDVKQLLKQEYPNAKTYIVNTRIDEHIVGGIKIVLAHQQLDLSLQRKLSTFKRLTMAGKE